MNVLIVSASRGIGLEFVTRYRAAATAVIATARTTPVSSACTRSAQPRSSRCRRRGQRVGLALSAAPRRRRGLAAALGVVAGCVVHTLVAASAWRRCWRRRATAFALVKCAGAAYLVWLADRHAARGRIAGSTPAAAAIERAASPGLWQLVSAKAC